VHEEHQAGVAEFAGNRQALGGGQASILETLLQLDLAAAAGEVRIPSLCLYERMRSRLEPGARTKVSIKPYNLYQACSMPSGGKGTLTAGRSPGPGSVAT